MHILIMVVRVGRYREVRGFGKGEKISFKDKLVGEIPGAYAQAFEFSDLWTWRRIQTRRWKSSGRG